MTPTLPDGASPLVGWALFAIVSIGWILREWQHQQTGNANRKKTEAETKKLLLDMLRVSAEDYVQQIEAMNEALAAEESSRPSSEELSALERIQVAPGIPSQAYPSVAAHFRARERVRKELPGVLVALADVRKREAGLTRELALGVDVADSSIADLRQRVELAANQVQILVELIAKSPRIVVSESEPMGAIDGDLWIQLPPGSDAAGSLAP